MGEICCSYENGRLRRVKPVYRCDSANAKEELVRSTMKRACELKGAPTMFPAEDHPKLDEALVALAVDWSNQDNSQSIAFERIIRNLPSHEFIRLASTIETMYWEKFNIDFEIKGKEVKGPGVLIICGLPIIAGALTKMFGFNLTSKSEHSSWSKPYEAAATTVAITFLILAVILMKANKPRLSEITAKSGVAAMAFAILLPLTLALHSVAALIFGLLMAFTVMGILTQI